MAFGKGKNKKSGAAGSLIDKIQCPYCGGIFSHRDVYFVADDGPEMPQPDELLRQFWESPELVNKHVGAIARRPFVPAIVGEYPTGGQDSIHVVDVGVRDEMVERVTYTVGASPRRYESVYRCCPHCHNILVKDYGRYPVRYISMVGVRRAGKTVYLRQLIQGIEYYGRGWGLNVDTIFLGLDRRTDLVKVNQNLPDTTPDNQFQNPEVVKVTMMSTGETYMLVFYDIAGEAFNADKYGAASVLKFGKYIFRADAIILLLDLENQVASMGQDGSKTGSIMTVPHVLNGQFGGDVNSPYVAVAISKTMDLYWKLSADPTKKSVADALQYVLNLQPLKPPAVQAFDAAQLFGKQEAARYVIDQLEGPGTTDILNSLLNQNTAYFAVESLGCEVRTDEENDDHIPVGPLAPRSIEEPLGWILVKLGIVREYLG